MKYTFLLLATLAILLSSCKKDDDPVINHADTVKFTNLHSPVVIDTTGQHTGNFVYFSFSKGDTVTSSESWDIAFRGTKIITNSGISGAGSAKATVVVSTFNDLTEAPSDSELNVDTATQLAIPSGSDNGWYHYEHTTHMITPIAGRIIVVKTNDGHYAKMEIISYYKDAPTNPNPLTDQGSTFTFNYAYQSDGTNKF